LLKRTITYENPFTEQEVSEEYYFHISKADLVEMEMEEHSDRYMKDGEELTGMQAKLQRIVDSEDGKAIMREFKDIIRRAYGKKDGDRFVKSAENWKEFEGSEAFSQLLFELCTQADAAAEFINAVVPGNLEKVAAEIRDQTKSAAKPSARKPAAKKKAGNQTLAEKIAGATAENPLVLTQAELVEIDSDELKSGIATGRLKLQ
jgi:hypothetical protein